MDSKKREGVKKIIVRYKIILNDGISLNRKLSYLRRSQL